MLDEQRPDAVYIAVPPSAAVAACEAVVARGIPFLVEKPLAATDGDGPARVATAIAERGLVAAVGYHLRALEQLPDVRERLTSMGLTVGFMPQQQLAARERAYTQTWTRLIKDLGFQPQ